MALILAYLDAGTGSLLLQAVLGGLAGIGVLYKTLKQRVSRGGGDAVEDVQTGPSSTGESAGD